MSIAQRISTALDEVFRSLKLLAVALVIGFGISTADADVASYLASRLAETTIFSVAANNGLTIKGTSVNGADNNWMCLDTSNGGCTDTNARSAYIFMGGAEYLGDMILSVIDDFFINTNNGVSALTITEAQAATFTGTVRSSATGSIGWSVVAAANQACNTTCTNACVVGQDGGALNVLVDCANATADLCLCAGAS